MATFDAATYTAQVAAADNAASMISTAELISGKSAHLQMTWTAPAGVVTSDEVRLGYIPSGMTVIPALSFITNDTAETGVSTLFAVNGTTISNGVSLTALGSKSLASAPATSVSSYKTTEREVLTMAVDGALTEGTVFWVDLYLVNSN